MGGTTVPDTWTLPKADKQSLTVNGNYYSTATLNTVTQLPIPVMPRTL
ncbi:hypothetical protein ACPUYX_08415 [Desulfosporosinus sp. SYSU MS00001]